MNTFARKISIIVIPLTCALGLFLGKIIKFVQIGSNFDSAVIFGLPAKLFTLVSYGIYLLINSMFFFFIGRLLYLNRTKQHIGVLYLKTFLIMFIFDILFKDYAKYVIDKVYEYMCW